MAGAVGPPGAPLHMGDALNLADAFDATGHYRKGRQGKPPLYEGSLFKAVKDFQTDEGLEADSWMAPGGPTLDRLNQVLPEKLEKPWRGAPAKSPYTPADELAAPAAAEKPARKLPADVNDWTFADLARHQRETGQPAVLRSTWSIFDGFPPGAKTGGGHGTPPVSQGQVQLTSGTVPPPPEQLQSVPPTREGPDSSGDEQAPASPAEMERLNRAARDALVSQGMPPAQADRRLELLRHPTYRDLLMQRERGLIIDRVFAMIDAGEVSELAAAFFLGAAVGHHFVPISVIRSLERQGLSPEASRVFRSATSGPYIDGSPHRWSPGHSDYNSAVREFWNQRPTQVPRDLRSMSAREANDFVAAVRQSNDPRIAGFHQHVLQCVLPRFLWRGHMAGYSLNYSGHGSPWLPPLGRTADHSVEDGG